MSQLLDIVAIAIVIFCALYALRALLPASVLARITGNSVPSRKSDGCGGCNNNCDTGSNKDDGCH